MEPAAPRRRRSLARAFALVALAPTLGAQSGTLRVVTRPEPSTPDWAAGGAAGARSLSADGRWVAFTSSAANIVKGPRYPPWNASQVYLGDRETGSLRLVSHALGSEESPSNDASSDAEVSADGRYVAFTSEATDLVPGQVDTAGSSDVFLWDRDSGQVALVSHTPGAAVTAGDWPSTEPALSADGRHVAFTSRARDLAPGAGSNGLAEDVFLFDRQDGSVRLMSASAFAAGTAGDARSQSPLLSDDGAWLAFGSYATDLVPGQVDTNDEQDVFLIAVGSGLATLVSHVAGQGSVAAGGSFPGALSGDGRRLAFVSFAPDLVPGQVDFEGTLDVFVHSRESGETRLASHDHGSDVTAGEADSWAPQLNRDGKVLAFLSQATNLVAGFVDGNFEDEGDAFVAIEGEADIRLASHVPWSATTSGGGPTTRALLSADGNRLLLDSEASDLVPGQVDTGTVDAFRLELATGEIELLSHQPGAPARAGRGGAGVAACSEDGAWVALTVAGDDLAAGDHNRKADVYLAGPGVMQLVSRRHSAMTPGTADSLYAALGAAAASDDGRWVAFQDAATNLVPGQELGPAAHSSSLTQVFLQDADTGATVLASHAAGAPSRTGNSSAWEASVSADGRFVAFTSWSTDLVRRFHGPHQINAFLFDRLSGEVTLVSHAAASPNAGSNGAARAPLVSADGSRVVFFSAATDLVPGQVDANGQEDVFLFERATGTLRLVSRAARLPAAASNGSSTDTRLALSADGSLVLFGSTGTDLVTGYVDHNGAAGEAYLFDALTGDVALVSHVPGSAVEGGSGLSTALGLSRDGRWALLSSWATNLVAGQVDTNGAGDVFLWDRLSNATRLVSHASSSPSQTGSQGSSDPVLSPDGAWVAFRSSATNLVAGAAILWSPQAYLFERGSGDVRLVSHLPGQPLVSSDFAARAPVISLDGRFVAFASSASDLVSGQPPPYHLNVFAWDRLADTVRLASRVPGTWAQGGEDDSQPAAVAVQGRVFFASKADNLAPLDLNHRATADGGADVFAWDPPASAATGWPRLRRARRHVR